MTTNLPLIRQLLTRAARFTAVKSTKPFSIVIVALAIGATSGAPALAAALANNMSCSSAKRYYISHRQINVRTYSGAVLPMYRGVPVNKRNTLLCGRGSSIMPVMVQTKDNPNCAIAYRCS